VVRLIPSVSIHDPNEVRHCTKSLGVSAQQLKEAVARVGTSAAKLRESLKNPFRYTKRARTDARMAAFHLEHAMSGPLNPLDVRLFDPDTGADGIRASVVALSTAL
jgi:hypothetical protein